MNAAVTAVPNSWAIASLGDVVQLVRGISFPSSDKAFSSADGLIGCLRTANVQREVEWDDLWFVPEKYVRSDKQMVQPHDILISTANSLELVGKVAQVAAVPHRATLGAFISALRPAAAIDARYVYYQLAASEYQARIRETASTTTNISNISTERMLGLEFHLAPRQEQDRIVAEIEALFTDLDAAVVALKQVQANLKRYRASVLKAACEGRLVPTEAELARNEGRQYETGEQLLARILKERRAKWETDQLAKMLAAGKPPKNDGWKKKYKDPEAPDTSDLPALPDGWAWVNLGQIAWSVKDGPHYSPKYAERGVPFITGGQVRPSGVDFDSARRIAPELHRELIIRCKPELGDVLYTKGGTTGIARVNTYALEFSVWVHVAVLKLVDCILPFYVQHALNSPRCYAQSQRYTHGVGNQDLGLTRMVRIVFGMPPLLEQKRIVDEVEHELTELDNMEASIAVQLRRADRLRQAILKRAFEGRLVPQDPNDEPASVLLERIRAERVANALPKATRSQGRRKARAAEVTL